MAAEIGREIKMLSNLIIREFQASMAKLDLDRVTAMNIWILGYLYNNRGRIIYQKDIEKEFNVARSTVAGLVKLMEQKGFIGRYDVETDARLKSLKLTEKGEQVYTAAHMKAEEIERRLHSGISGDELEAFIKTVEKMKKSLESKCEKGEIYD